jgi:pimeloyl-ACP methyl ester carboxylesterase
MSLVSNNISTVTDPLNEECIDPMDSPFGEYVLPPPELVDQNNEGRLVPILRIAARLHDAAKTLQLSAGLSYCSFRPGLTSHLILTRLTDNDVQPFFANAQALAASMQTLASHSPNTLGLMALAVADLSVSGRASYANFLQVRPTESDLYENVLMGAGNDASGDEKVILDIVSLTLDRAYHVVWYLRDLTFRKNMPRGPRTWIAVSGEDDPPHRPVNVPSAPYPQYDIQVPVAVRQVPGKTTSVSARYMIASLEPPPKAQPANQVNRSSANVLGSTLVDFSGLAKIIDPPQAAGLMDTKLGQITKSPAVTPTTSTLTKGAIQTIDKARELPAEPVPWISPDDEVIIYIHGMTSSIEESTDLVPQILSQGHAKNKKYAVIAMDLPTNGYSSMLDDAVDVTPVPANSWSGDPFSSDTTNTVCPLLDFYEEFLVSFLKQLRTALTINTKLMTVIGGSLGGNLTLRLAERGTGDLWWLSRIVPWSPACSYTSLQHDTTKHFILSESGLLDKLNIPEDEASRRLYFFQVFEETRNIGVIQAAKPQPQYWYRDNWPCKSAYIQADRWARQEIYNEKLRNWHWRIAFEQAIFSHWNTDVPVGQGTTDNVKVPRYEWIIVKTLLAAGTSDSSAWPFDIYPGTTRLAAQMSQTPGLAIFFSDTGHSIHSERPQFLAQKILEFMAI